MTRRQEAPATEPLKPGDVTNGDWAPRFYVQPDDQIARLRENNLEPTRALTNEGQAIIMATFGDDRARIALVECQTTYKRGQGYSTDCAERDANARMMAASKDLAAALDGVLAIVPWRTKDGAEQPAVTRARAAMAKAHGVPEWPVS
jgi:hypothetical protein